MLEGASVARECDSLPFHLEGSADLTAPVEAVFDFLDDFEQLGAHMMRSTAMMAGSRMRYEFDAARGRKVNARVRVLGSILGIKLQIEECVTERAPPFRKAWRTTGPQRMLVLDAYRMGYELVAREQGCRARVFIDYAIPPAGLSHWLARAAAARYARWCVNGVLAGVTGRYGTERSG